VDRACVPRGGRQGLTVRTKPATTVAYSTEYSDGSTELTNRSYTTGFGYGVADPSGTYRVTWIVPTIAPPGPATVHLAATEPIPATVKFTVAAREEDCP
jgi:hypothetical protein